MGALTTEGVALRDNNPAAVRGARERTIADKIEAIFGRSAELGDLSRDDITDSTPGCVSSGQGSRIEGGSTEDLTFMVSNVDTPFVNYSRVC